MTIAQNIDLHQTGYPIAKVNKKFEVNNNASKVNFQAQYPDMYVRSYGDDEQQQKPTWKDKLGKIFSKNNILTGVSVASGLAIIAMVLLQLKANKAGDFKLSQLEFKNLSKDDSIFDIKTSKSLHSKVKTFFADLMQFDKIPDDIAKKAGVLGEGGTNSVLLLGGSGVGKTEVIKAYAKAVDADYVAIKLSDFSNSYVNGTSKNISIMIDELVKRAKDNPLKKLVISLDEVDALVKVTAHDTSGEISKNRQSLLTGLDELLKLPNIKLFSSSNANINNLDGAFVRRCGYNLEIPMPDATQLKEALKFQLRKCEGVAENFFDGKKLNKLLDELVDRKFAFGDIKNIVQAAKTDYANQMFNLKNQGKSYDIPFNVENLRNALAKIEKTAGEMAAETGSIL